MKTLAFRRRLKTIQGFFQQGGVFLYSRFVAPRANEEDERRREFILTVVLLATLFLLVCAELSLVYDSVRLGNSYHGVRPGPFCVLIVFFFCLYTLSRKGYFTFASYVVLLLYFMGTAYSMFKWGAALPVVLVSCAAIIVMASILISTRFGFVATGVVIGTLFIVGYMQTYGSVHPELYWQSQEFRLFGDGIVYAIVLLLIGVMSWLSNREKENSLRRARASEAALLRERDLLEMKVEERTEELKRMQLDELSRMYRFVEFGRLASGVVHDLMNPLTAISLNITKLDVNDSNTIEAAKVSLERAVSASQRMGMFMQAVRNHIGEQELQSSFSVNEQIYSVMELFRYKAQVGAIVLQYNPPEQDITLFGNALKFHQVVANLVSNALDACMRTVRTGPQSVSLFLTVRSGIMDLHVHDTGPGIFPEHMEKIFEPFFTTKTIQEGTGIGLSTAKHIVESSFNGSITPQNNPGGGALFVVSIPL